MPPGCAASGGKDDIGAPCCDAVIHGYIPTSGNHDTGASYQEKKGDRHSERDTYITADASICDQGKCLSVA